MLMKRIDSRREKYFQGHIPSALRLAKIVLRLRRRKDDFIQNLANLGGIGLPCLLK